MRLMTLYTLMANVPTNPQLPSGGWSANGPKELLRQHLVREPDEPAPQAHHWYMALDEHPNRAFYDYVARCHYLHGHLQKTRPAGTPGWPPFLQWPLTQDHRRGAYLPGISKPALPAWGWCDPAGDSMVLAIVQDRVEVPTRHPDTVQTLAGLSAEARLKVFGRFCAVCGTPLPPGEGLNRCSKHHDERLDRLFGILRDSVTLDEAKLPQSPCFPNGVVSCCQMNAPYTCRCACHNKRIDAVLALQDRARKIFAELFGQRF